MNLHRILSAVAVAALCALSIGAAAAAPPPVEDFARLPLIDDAVPSPSGKRLAVLTFGKDGHRVLAVMDLDPISKPRVVGGFQDADVDDVEWVNDERLVYTASQRRAELDEGGAGTFAVDHDGGGARQLIAWRRPMSEPTGSHISSKILPFNWRLHSTIDDGSSDVFVEHVSRTRSNERGDVTLARLDTVSGAVHDIGHGAPDGTRGWLIDRNHKPRVLTAYRDGRQKIYWRSPTDEKWELVADFDPLAQDAFWPVFVGAEDEVLVTARIDSDTWSLHQFDPRTRRINPEPMVRVKGYDVTPHLDRDSRTRRLVGMHLTTDRPMSLWLDSNLERIQRGVDAALPAGRSNRLYCGRCESAQYFVVRSSSDRRPSEFFLFDRSKGSMQRIGATRPWIDEETQGRRTLHRIAARDGVSMPVYVTHPLPSAERKPLPAVVLVHGGPWVRGTSLNWRAEAQFLASRGYVVLEPEFRGSTGYGFALFKAGWKEWGRSMQTDLVDAVEWAVKEGWVDRNRVCIVGASYGGYAALMGPIVNPGVYRCAVSHVGVTDVGLMYSLPWSDISEEGKRYSMPVLIGDPKDTQRLDAISPLKRVSEIKIPLLIAHGAADRRVPIEHARQFGNAARAAGVSVEQIYYPNEGHGFFEPENQADYWRRIERFLAKSLEEAR